MPSSYLLDLYMYIYTHTYIYKMKHNDNRSADSKRHWDEKKTEKNENRGENCHWKMKKLNT